MATHQLERPLSEVEDIAERVQASNAERWDRYDGPPTWDMRRVRDGIQRVLRDPMGLATIAIATVSLVVLTALVWGRRPPPRSAEDVLLERSRETFERAREALEAMASKVAALER